ncbi:cilia- and flagella-associated protein 99 [Genypterus blacodes]|uniref:cilia- and flagella-associated protein 99 n=1 Tax=Genypterus blacodes TaxID=154954 RepID=UPI003F75BBA5
MASIYGLLVRRVCVLLDELGADGGCLGDVAEEASEALQSDDSMDKEFILDIVSGCIEYKTLLDIVIDVFYVEEWKSVSAGDRSQYVVICYLLTFALDDLGLQCFSSIVKSLGSKKMHLFLGFFFTNLTTWIQGEWSRIYDATYVEKTWIAPLLRWRPEINVLMDQLAARISSMCEVKKVLNITTPQEFSLTKPKPRPLPMPELIPLQEQHKPVPESTYKTPKEMQTMEELRQRNRKEAEEILYEANAKQFRCGNAEKSERTKKVLSQIHEDFDSKLRFDSFQSSALPASHKMNSMPIKLNSTVILRQRAQHKRLAEKEHQRLDHLIGGAGEPSSFLQWQKEMRERDLQEEVVKSEARRMEGRISNDKAAIARAYLMEHNQKAAQLHKEEFAQQMRSYAQRKLQQEKEIRDLAEQGRQKSKASQEKLLALKRNIVKEVSEQNQALRHQALKEAQADQRRRWEIVQELHAIETVPYIRGNLFDNTEIKGHSVLGEMSLEELKLRLALLKVAQQSELQERRMRVVEEQQSKQQYLVESIDAVSLHKKAFAQAAALRSGKMKRTTRLDLLQAVAQDERMLAVKKKVDEIKEERQRLKQIEINKTKTSGQVAAQKNNPKVKSWAQLEKELQLQIQTEATDIVSSRKTLTT